VSVDVSSSLCTHSPFLLAVPLAFTNGYDSYCTVQVVSQSDEAALEHCVSVHVDDNQDAGWRVCFRFADTNPYFSDVELVKECTVADNGSFV
jgi:hypothetical protein